MTALTQDKGTAWREGNFVTDDVAASQRIFQGAVVVLNATGFAEPASTATGLIARGIAQGQVDNSQGADGDEAITCRRGVSLLVNDGSVTRADIGADAYLVDDQTVANTDGTGTRSVAGEIIDVDTDGVWVQIG